MVDVPRQRDGGRDEREQQQPAPIPIATAKHRDCDQAGEKDDARLLRHQRESDRDPRERGGPQAGEPLRGQDRPGARRRHRRLGRIDHEDVHLRDIDRNAEREHPCEQASLPSVDEPSDAVAADYEQGDEDEEAPARISKIVLPSASPAEIIGLPGAARFTAANHR